MIDSNLANSTQLSLNSGNVNAHSSLFESPLDVLSLWPLTKFYRRSPDTMAIFSADNRRLNLAVRALQIVLAIAVMGTFGYGSQLIVLLWLAGWIAAAANIGSSACSEGYGSSSAVKAITAFGARAWLLFMFTTAMTISLFNRKHLPVHHTTSQITCI